MLENKSKKIKYSEFKQVNNSSYYISYVNIFNDTPFATDIIKLTNTGGGMQAIGKYIKNETDQIKSGIRIPIKKNSDFYDIDKTLKHTALHEKKLKDQLIDELNLKKSVNIKYKSIIVESKNQKYDSTVKCKFNVYTDENKEMKIGTQFFKFDDLREYLKVEAKNDTYELFNVSNIDDLNSYFFYNSQTEMIMQILVKKLMVNKISSKEIELSYVLEAQQILFQVNKKKRNNISDIPMLIRKYSKF